MARDGSPSEVRVGPQGRLVIPAELRRSLGFHPGDRLIVREEDGKLVLEKADTVERRLKARYKHISQEESLADELISERRTEAQRERGK